MRAGNRHSSEGTSTLIISAGSQCRLSVPSINAYQCPSVPPNSSNQCRLPVPISAAYQCHI
ncbi:unnamed protein product [Staurois parvus]|uniref:Uncharacterized protein n=1 Tax=Staurois parvus TaxID=386267 RepID=A0ABN9GZL3_9NEOB|nr:unnamed protein product [Staurois parvus]